MDSSNLPSQTDLNSLYGAWNPMSYMQGQQNQDLAAQFRDQAFKANQNDVTRGALQNDQSVQMNPLLLTHQGLVNTGLDLGNQGASTKNASAAIDLSQKQLLAPDSLDSQREELHAKLGDAQYTTLSNRILQSHLDNIKSGDPDKIAQTKSMIDFLGGPIASKVSDRSQARDLAELHAISQQNAATTMANSRTGVAEIKADKPGADPYIVFNRLPPATRLGVSQSALIGGIDPVTHEPLTDATRSQLEALIKQDAAVVDANAAARGQGQGVTATVNPSTGKIEIVNKQVPSVAGTAKLSDSELLNKYLKK